MKTFFLYGLWTLAALLFFLWLLFPGEFAEALIEAHADRRLSPGTLNVEGVSPALPLGLSVKGVALTLPGLPPVTARNIRVTPSWLTLVTSRPGAEMTASLFGGKAAGSARIRYKGRQWSRIRGRLKGMDLATVSPLLKGRVPIEWSVSGRGDGTFELSRDNKAKGTGRLSLANVTVGFDDPLIPLDNLEFASVVVDVEVDGSKLTFSRIHVEGTEVDAELKGTLTLSRRLESSRINISGTLNPDPGFVKELSDRLPISMLMDPKLLKRGRIPLRISGTLSNPRVSLK